MDRQNQKQTTRHSSRSNIIKEFECSVCQEVYKYRAFSTRLRDDKMQCFLLEEAFHMDDPFEESSKLPFIVGGVCNVCNKAVCVDTKCSTFYTKRFCLNCIKKKSESFPREVLKDVI